MSELPPASESPAGDEAPEQPTRGRNPWLWATAGLAVVAIGLGVWALHERSNADDAKADLQAEEQKATTTKSSTTEVHVQTQPQTATQEQQGTSETTTGSDDNGPRVGLLAGAAAAFAAARKQLNENQAQVDDLEKEVDKANAEADKAQQDAEKAKAQAADTSDAQKKAEAEAEQAQAEKRQFGAKAQAAAACAKSMLEIVGDIPKGSSPEEGLKAAGDEITALVPKCKDSVASAGG